MSLSREELQRYNRHCIMPEVGVAGQEKLKSSSVCVVGTGGLGSPLGLYLAAVGVGRIGLVDFDQVDASNLHRQILFGTEDVGRSKLQAASNRLRSINPHVNIETHETRLTSQNALEILKNYDVVVDGTDNYPTRYLVNDACVLLKKPNVYGSIFRFEGQVSVFDARNGPCYRCLYAVPPPPGLVPSCAEGGVLGILPGVIGTLQATETVKLLLGIGKTLVGRLLLYDALQMSFRQLNLRKDPNCPVCSANPKQTTLIDYEQFCGIRDDKKEEQKMEISATDLKEKMKRKDSFVLLDVREPHEWDLCRIEGARLIPLGEVSKRLSELQSSDEIVVYCHKGGRSRRAQGQLLQAGFSKVINLGGGIDAWSRDVDPAVTRY